MARGNGSAAIEAGGGSGRGRSKDAARQLAAAMAEDSSAQHREAQLAITAEVVAFQKKHASSSAMGGTGAMGPLSFLDQFTGFVISELATPGLEIDNSAVHDPKVVTGGETKSQARVPADEVQRAAAPALASSSSTFKLSSAQDSAAKDIGDESRGRDAKRSLAPSASERGGASCAAPAQPRSLLQMKRDEIYDHVEGAVLDAGAVSAGLAVEDTSAEPPRADGQAHDSAAAPPAVQAAKVKIQRPQLLQRVGPGSTFVAPLSAPSDLGCASTFARALASSSREQGSLLELVGSLLLNLPTEQLFPGVLRHIMDQLLAEAQSQRAVLGLLGSLPLENGCRAAVVERAILALPDSTRVNILKRVRRICAGALMVGCLACLLTHVFCCPPLLNAQAMRLLTVGEKMRLLQPVVATLNSRRRSLVGLQANHKRDVLMGAIEQMPFHERLSFINYNFGVASQFDDSQRVQLLSAALDTVDVTQRKHFLSTLVAADSEGDRDDVIMTLLADLPAEDKRRVMARLTRSSAVHARSPEDDDEGEESKRKAQSRKSQDAVQNLMRSLMGQSAQRMATQVKHCEEN